MTTEVATKEQEDSLSYLEQFKEAPAKADDNFDQSDVVIPRIKLLQGTSEEVTVFDNARPGEFWHTGLDKPLGESFEFIVCTRRKKYLLVAPMEDGQNLLASANDAELWDQCGEWEVKFKDRKDKVKWVIPESCVVKDKNGEILGYSVEKSGLLNWGTSKPDDPDSPPAATTFYDYLVLLPEYLELGPVVISLARSQIKKAKRGLNDKIAMHQGAGRPMQALKFIATAVDDRNDNNEPYQNWSFRQDGFVPEAQYLQAKNVSETMREYAVKDQVISETSEGDKYESDEF